MSAVMSADACPAMMSRDQTSFSLMAAADTLLILPAFVTLSIVLCFEKNRKSYVWACWFVACVALVGGAIWATRI